MAKVFGLLVVSDACRLAHAQLELGDVRGEWSGHLRGRRGRGLGLHGNLGRRERYFISGRCRFFCDGGIGYETVAGGRVRVDRCTFADLALVNRNVTGGRLVA